MKKIVIVILLILPFILAIMISLTGKIVALTSYIAVDSISFVDEYDKEIDSYVTIKVGDEGYEPIIKIYPIYATNQKYTLVLNEKYSSLCKLEDGKVIGLAHGFAELVVVSDYSKKIVDRITLKISDEEVTKITLPEVEISAGVYEKTLNVGEKYQLHPTVLPTTAADKFITYTSSNEALVTVNANGQITVLQYSTQPVDITLTSRANPNVSVRLTINITQNANMLNFTTSMYTLTSDTLNLLDILEYNDEHVNINDVEFVVSWSKAKVEGTTLTVTATESKIFKVTAIWGDYITSLYITYNM